MKGEFITMKPVFEVDDFVEIKDMEFFSGLRGMVTEVRNRICTIHINKSAEHSEFYIYAEFGELNYINHYKKEI
jgi:hypothetical protein